LYVQLSMRWCLLPYTLLILISVLLLATKPAKSNCITANVSDGENFTKENRFSLLLKTVSSQSKKLLLKTSAPVTHYNLTQLLKKAKQNYTEGNYAVSLKNALLAEKVARQQHNDTVTAAAGNLIALQYLARDKYAEAFPYLKAATAINRKYGKYNQLASNQLNLSMYYASQNRLDKAISYAYSCLQLSARIKRPDLVAMAANHLGDYYFLAKNEQKAKEYHESVVNNKTFQSDWENSYALTGLARIALSQKDYKKAITSSIKAFELARKVNAKWDAQQALNVLYKAYQQSGDYTQAFNYLSLYKNYSDSLFSDKKEQEINFLLLKDKEAENLDLKRRNMLEQQQQRINRMIILIVTLLMVFFFALLALLYQRFLRSRRYNTALKNKTDKIEEKSKVINEQNLNLNQLNYTKDQLFSIIGHDLRSPFASVLTALELFKSGNFDSEEISELAGKLYEQVALTTKMLDNLLLWGSSQLGGLQTQHRNINLAATTSGVVEVLKPVAALKQISIDFDPASQAFISADADQVKVIIQNLIANAIKFTSNGGKITITLTERQQHSELAVSDNGMGMAPDTLHQLLRYGGKRISTSGTAGERGIGLGLLLVKDFAEQNGATIQVQSELGKGTTFYLSFIKVTNTEI